MADLKAMGYQVFRTAGSHGPFDVIAYNLDAATKKIESGVRFIQCKRVKTGEAKPKVDLPPVPPSCTAELWVWRDKKGWDWPN